MILNYFIKNIMLKNFFKIKLSSIEKKIAIDAINKKYSKSIKKSFFSSLLIIPALIYFKISILTSILIPITIVAGSSWFSISLANIKKKFEQFGLELTTNIFEAFCTSLILLFYLVFFSFIKNDNFVLTGFFANKIFVILSAFLGLVVVFRILYLIFIGALKYDINDSMLSGQNEAAEEFYNKSLSLLHQTSNILRSGINDSIANYNIGFCLYEIFSYLKTLKLNKEINKKIDEYLEKSNKLIFKPTIEQKKAKKITIFLIDSFMSFCKDIELSEVKRSYSIINDELFCLKNNKEENFEMVLVRFSVIFTHIADLLNSQGESLFVS